MSNTPTILLRGEQRVVLVPTAGLGQLTSLRMVFSTSHLDDPQAGELALLAEWLERGTTHRDRQGLGEAFVATGATPDWSLQSTGFEVGIEALHDLGDEALALLAEQLFSPAFSLEELEQLRAELEEDDEASLDEPGFVASLNSRFVRWGAGHRATLPPRGTPSSRAAIEADALTARHEELMREPAIILLVGPHPERWLETLDKLFAAYGLQPACSLKKQELPHLSAEAPHTSVVDVPELEHAMVTRWGSALTNDGPAMVGSLRLVHAALCDGMSAPLLHRLRGQAGLSYALHSSLVDRGRHFEQVFEIEPSPQRVSEALEAAHALWCEPDVLAEADLRRGAMQLRMDEALAAADPWRAAAHLLRTSLVHGRDDSWLDARNTAQRDLSGALERMPLRSWGPALSSSHRTAICAPAASLEPKSAALALPLERFLADFGW